MREGQGSHLGLEAVVGALGYTRQRVERHGAAAVLRLKNNAQPCQSTLPTHGEHEGGRGWSKQRKKQGAHSKGLSGDRIHLAKPAQPIDCCVVDCGIPTAEQPQPDGIHPEPGKGHILTKVQLRDAGTQGDSPAHVSSPKRPPRASALSGRTTPHLYTRLVSDTRLQLDKSEKRPFRSTCVEAPRKVNIPSSYLQRCLWLR